MAAIGNYSSQNGSREEGEGLITVLKFNMEFQIFTRDAYAVDIAVASHIFIQVPTSSIEKFIIS